MSPTTKPISDEDRDKIVSMYKAGSRIADITRETGRPRPTIYWVLQQKGVHPGRIHRPSQTEVSVEQMLDRWRDCIAENAVLKADLSKVMAERDNARAALSKARKR